MMFLKRWKISKRIKKILVRFLMPTKVGYLNWPFHWFELNSWLSIEKCSREVKTVFEEPKFAVMFVESIAPKYARLGASKRNKVAWIRKV